VLTALVEWLREPGLAELRRSFTTWLVAVLLPGRVPGLVVPEVADLQEVRSMLAESVMDWTRQWKQEGLEEGRQEGRQEALASVREVLCREVERRFGPLREEVRLRVEAMDSIEALSELLARVGVASSLDALGPVFQSQSS